MNRKVLAILLILLTSAIFLTTGCAGRKGTATPTIMPSATPAATVSPTATPSDAPPGAPTATPAASIAPAPGSSNASKNLNIDPSLLSISGEGQDEGGYPETGLPTPTLD